MNNKIIESIGKPSCGLHLARRLSDGGSDVKFVFLTLKGVKAFSRSFKEARPFSEGFAAVKFAPGKWWGHIRTDGKTAYKARYLDVRNFHEGRAAVEFAPGKWGHIHTDGTPAYEARYIYVRNFNEGRAAVVFLDDTTGYINMNGMPVG